jgi:hypothetical protein
MRRNAHKAGFRPVALQRYQDADRVKARLALAGVSAGIQRVVINGSDVWYRVRVGPFNDLKSLQGARQPHGGSLQLHAGQGRTRLAAGVGRIELGLFGRRPGSDVSIEGKPGNAATHLR